MQQEVLGGPRQAAMYVVQLIKKEKVVGEAVRRDGGTGLSREWNVLRK